MLKAILKKIRSFLMDQTNLKIHQLNEYTTATSDQFVSIQQKLLLSQATDSDRPLSDYGFSVFSESDEDGILLRIFAIIGFRNKVAIDVGGGSGLGGSNTANLILHHGFDGLLIEGNNENAEYLRKIYGEKRQTRHYPPRVICEYVTTANINSLFTDNSIAGEVELLSIDIDSIDYWIWEAIDVISPRVVVVEIQCILPADVSWTVPKDFCETVFETIDNRRYGIYNSASLRAFERLGKSKGYRLVATSKLGFNAFFLRNDLGIDKIPAISVDECLDKPFVKWAQKTFYGKIKDLDWTEI
ncbi:MAG: hypothetical protein R3F50_11330 [Gammaproteobacteria bacterium]